MSDDLFNPGDAGVLSPGEALDAAFLTLPAMVRRRLARRMRLPADISTEEAALQCNCSITTLFCDRRAWQEALVGVYVASGFTPRNIAMTLGIDVQEVVKIQNRNLQQARNTVKRAA